MESKEFLNVSTVSSDLAGLNSGDLKEASLTTTRGVRVRKIGVKPDSA